jgi:hypothetical protein
MQDVAKACVAQIGGACRSQLDTLQLFATQPFRAENPSGAAIQPRFDRKAK